MLLDANLLLYDQITDYPQHSAVRQWFIEQLESGQRLGIPWPSFLAFIRLSTNPGIYREPFTQAAAWDRVDHWLSMDSVWIPSPTAQHGAILGPLLIGVAQHPNDVPDAHLAALAIEHNLTLVSTDKDFGRFPGLRWLNPLAVGQ